MSEWLHVSSENRDASPGPTADVEAKWKCAASSSLRGQGDPMESGGVVDSGGIHVTSSCWWLSLYPSEKYESIGMMKSQLDWKIKVMFQTTNQSWFYCGNPPFFASRLLGWRWHKPNKLPPQPCGIRAIFQHRWPLFHWNISVFPKPWVASESSITVSHGWPFYVRWLLSGCKRNKNRLCWVVNVSFVKARTPILVGDFNPSEKD